MRFGDDHRSYESYLCIPEMYTKEKKFIIKVYKEIADLFQNHHDLLLEFGYYLSDTSLGISKVAKSLIALRK